MSSSPGLCLMVRRIIPASCTRLFEAWTQASHLQAWWGPRDVRCIHAECETRVGGRYRIDNELPNGTVIVIEGEFLAVEAPYKLVYTWQTRALNRDEEESGMEDRAVKSEILPELVTVRFVALGPNTEVIVCHERIEDRKIYEEHERGWSGCLDGLVDYVG